MDQSIANDVCNACWVSFPAWNSYDDYPYSDSLLSPGNCDAFDHCHIDPPDSINCGIGFLDGEDTSLVKIDYHPLPVEYDLLRVAPNPFNPVTNITYDIASATDVTLEIYNVMGQRVRTLAQGSHEPGRYRVMWNATNDYGQSLSSGMYIYRIQAGDFVSVKKLILMK